MNEGLISRRYAMALLKFAQDRNSAERIYKETKVLEENFISHPDLQKALLNPVLPVQDKERLLSAAAGADPDDDFLRFVRLVIKNRRESFMRSIGLMYQKIYRGAHDIEQVRIITAAPLNDEIIGKIKEAVLRKSSHVIEFTHEVDPAIIGGFILKVNSMQLDASVNKELKLLRLKLLSSRRL